MNRVVLLILTSLAGLCAIVLALFYGGGELLLCDKQQLGLVDSHSNAEQSQRSVSIAE